MSLWYKSLGRRLRIVEAMLWLLLAHVLIRFVALQYWRSTLGRVSPVPLVSQSNDMQEISFVAMAVMRGAHHLPFATVCLPRAMAVQWMLRRRGYASSMIFGITQDLKKGNLRDLHAWVEAAGQTVIGDNPDCVYHRGLIMVQP